MAHIHPAAFSYLMHGYGRNHHQIYGLEPFPATHLPTGSCEFIRAIDDRRYCWLFAYHCHLPLVASSQMDGMDWSALSHLLFHLWRSAPIGHPCPNSYRISISRQLFLSHHRFFIGVYYFLSTFFFYFEFEKIKKINRRRNKAVENVDN